MNLVLDVLEAIGEPREILEQWQARHERLGELLAGEVIRPGDNRRHHVAEQPAQAHPPAELVDSLPVTEAEEASVSDEGSDAPVGHRRHGWWIGTAVATAALIAVTVWWLATRSEELTARTIVVQNKVAFGPWALVEDDSPSYLASRPITSCANIPGCKVAGTDLASGDTVEALCQLQGATLTNADVRSSGIENNPNAAASSLWYGIRWRDGRRGYLSEVYVAPMYRGGLQLPPC